jgi:hypothetical protein
MGGGKLKNAAILRQKTEEPLNDMLKGNREHAYSSKVAVGEPSETNLLKQLHESEVYQIELKMTLEMMKEEMSLVGDQLDYPLIETLVEKAENMIHRKIKCIILTKDEMIQQNNDQPTLLIWKADQAIN